MPQCRARRRGTDQQCKAQAMKGGYVCRLHGGAAPQAKEAARIRLMMAADRAAGELERQMLGKGKNLTDADRRAAAIAILDRAGLKPTDKIEISGPEGGPIQFEDLSIYTVEELELLELMTRRAVERAQLSEQSLMIEAVPEDEEQDEAHEEEGD